MARTGGEWETWISVQRPWSLLGAGHGCQQSHTHRRPFHTGCEMATPLPQQINQAWPLGGQDGKWAVLPIPPIQAGDICASATHCSPLGSSQAEGPGRQTDKGSSWRAKGGPQQVRCRQKQRRLGPGRDRAHIEPGTSRALRSHPGRGSRLVSAAGTKLLAGTVKAGGTWGWGAHSIKHQHHTHPARGPCLWTETRTAVPVRGSHARLGSRMQKDL